MPPQGTNVSRNHRVLPLPCCRCDVLACLRGSAARLISHLGSIAKGLSLVRGWDEGLPISQGACESLTACGEHGDRRWQTPVLTRSGPGVPPVAGGEGKRHGCPAPPGRSERLAWQAGRILPCWDMGERHDFLGCCILHSAACLGPCLIKIRALMS